MADEHKVAGQRVLPWSDEMRASFDRVFAAEVEKAGGFPVQPDAVNADVAPKQTGAQRLLAALTKNDRRSPGDGGFAPLDGCFDLDAVARALELEDK